MSLKDQIKRNNEYVLALYRAGASLSCIDPTKTFFPPRPMAKPIMKKDDHEAESNVIEIGKKE